MEILDPVALGIKYVAVGVIVYGVLCGLVRFIPSEVRALRGQPVTEPRQKLREHVGYYLLLGLEFLIAADILVTIVTPGREELINLAIIVVLRTIVSFSLNWELDRHHRRRSHTASG